MTLEQKVGGVGLGVLCHTRCDTGLGVSVVSPVGRVIFLYFPNLVLPIYDRLFMSTSIQIINLLFGLNSEYMKYLLTQHCLNGA